MFTGIITAIGTVTGVEDLGRDRRLHIDAGDLDLSDIAIGDSICVSGVCLTVVTTDGRGFAADVSSETLSCTTLDRFVQKYVWMVDEDTMTQAIHDVYCGIMADHQQPNEKDREQARRLIAAIGQSI